MRVAVIANMKAGLEQFIYRELCFFEESGLDISLFPTRFGPGLYNAHDDWRLVRWQPLVVLLWQVVCFAQSPFRYIRLFYEAIRYRALVDFALAHYFAPKMRDVDTIYATFGDHKLFVGYFCKRILEKPLVVEIHAYELYENPNPRLFVHALHACDQIITVTEHNREYLREHFHVDPAAVELVRYSLDLQNYHPEEKFVILIVAFFTDRKGHDTLLQAVKELGNEKIEVWVVGGAAGRQSLVDVRALAHELDIESQVAFFGMLGGTALRAVYRACDAFCLPSRKDKGGAFEGFPNVLIEAMAMGKPVITTRHVEIPRIIPELLIDENDVAGLAAAIQQLYESTALRKRLGAQNRQLAEQHFSPENAAKTAAILRRVAGQEALYPPTQATVAFH